MKICYMSPCLFSNGGVSRVLTCVASELSERGHDVTVIVTEKPVDEDRSKYGLNEKVKVEFIPSVWVNEFTRRCTRKAIHMSGATKAIPAIWEWAFASESVCAMWLEYLGRDSYDVVIAVHGRLSYTLGKIADKLNCMTIGWQHSSYDAYLRTKRNGTGYWNEDYMFEKYIPRLDYNVVLNDNDKALYKKEKNIDSVVIANPKSFVSEEKSTLEAKRFVSVGALRYAKGYDMLIEAFAEFSKENPEWLLDIYGEGPEREGITEKIAALRLNDKVKLCGWTNEVKREMMNSSGILLSSRWEGMPMVVLEALELGIPVVSFDIPAIRPLVTDGIEGMVVDCFDVQRYAVAMSELASDCGRRVQMGKNAAQKAKAFDVGYIAHQWEELFAAASDKEK